MQFVFIAVVIGTGLYFSLADASKLSFVSSAENFRAEFLPHSTAYMWQEVFFSRGAAQWSSHSKMLWEIPWLIHTLVNLLEVFILLGLE